MAANARQRHRRDAVAHPADARAPAPDAVVGRSSVMRALRWDLAVAATTSGMTLHQPVKQSTGTPA